MKKELTNAFLMKIKPPLVGRDEISDTKRVGLRLRVYPKRAVWMYEKRVKGGAKRKHTLGTFCTWTKSGKRDDGAFGLAQARALALEIEAEAAQGIDRIALANEAKVADAAAKSREVLLANVISKYDSLHLSGLKRGRERKAQIESALETFLASPITTLTRSDFQKAIDAKAAEGRKTAANRLRAALLAFSKWAWERGYLDTNIGAGIPKASKEKSRERIPSLEEVRLVWNASFEMGELWGPVIRLLILTAQRRGEILELRWSEVDFERAQIVKPGSRTKNGKSHITHLSPPALSELRTLAVGQEADTSDLVFTTTGSTPPSGVSKAKARLDGHLGDKVAPWHIHDLRTSFSTAMAESGVPENVADRILNHSASGSAPSAVARVYNKAEMLPQRAAALDRWADMVTETETRIVKLGS